MLEIYIGQVIENNAKDINNAEVGSYSIFQRLNNVPQSPLTGCSSDFVSGYLAAKISNYLPEDVSLYNGINKRGQAGWYPKLLHNRISKDDLQQIIETSTLDDGNLFEKDYSVNDFEKV